MSLVHMKGVQLCCQFGQSGLVHLSGRGSRHLAPSSWGSRAEHVGLQLRLRFLRLLHRGAVDVPGAAGAEPPESAARGRTSPVSLQRRVEEVEEE
jgi:hypothetical protein